MFLGCRCCDEPCNTAARSGGAGITINRYAMPDYGGTVEFYYNAYSVPDRFTIYNTNSEDEIYFDTGERVSGSKTIKFYKPKGVRSVSVKVDGPSGTLWDYRIGCPVPVRCGISDGNRNRSGSFSSLTVNISNGFNLEVTYPRLGQGYGFLTILTIDENDNILDSVTQMYFDRLDSVSWGLTLERPILDQFGKPTNRKRRFTYELVNQLEFPYTYRWSGGVANGTYILDENNNFEYFKDNYPFCNTNEYDSVDSCLDYNTFLRVVPGRYSSCALSVDFMPTIESGLGQRLVGCVLDYYDLNERNYYVQTRLTTPFNMMGIVLNSPTDIIIPHPFRTDLLPPFYLWSPNRCNYYKNENNFIENYKQYPYTLWDGCLLNAVSTFIENSLISDNVKWKDQNPGKEMYNILDPLYPFNNPNFTSVGFRSGFEIKAGTQSTFLSSLNERGSIDRARFIENLMQAGELVIKKNNQNVTFNELYPYKDSSDPPNSYPWTLNPDILPRLTVEIVDYTAY